MHHGLSLYYYYLFLHFFIYLFSVVLNFGITSIKAASHVCWPALASMRALTAISLRSFRRNRPFHIHRLQSPIHIYLMIKLVHYVKQSSWSGTRCCGHRHLGFREARSLRTSVTSVWTRLCGPHVLPRRGSEGRDHGCGSRSTTEESLQHEQVSEVNGSFLFQYSLIYYKEIPDIEGWSQDCGNSSAIAMGLPQSCARPSILAN